MHTHSYVLTYACSSIQVRTLAYIAIHISINTRTQKHAHTLFLHLSLLEFDELYKKVYLSLYAY